MITKITKITAKNFKGETFQQDIGRLTLVVGDNGSGKSSRSLSATLAILGYIPGTSKMNQNIYTSYSDGKNPMSVGIEYDGKHFERIFQKSASGVTLKLKINSRLVSKEQFVSGMASVPKIIDIGDFVGLSNQKKMDAIFELFPPAKDTAELFRKIQESRERINNLHAQEKSARGVIERLSVSISQFQKPNYELPELTAEIKSVEAELVGVKESLLRITLEKAAEQKAEAEQKRIAKAEEAEKKEQKSDQAQPEPELKNFEPVQQVSPIFNVPELWQYGGENPFDNILRAFDKTGCGSCYAKIITIKAKKVWSPSQSIKNIMF